MKKFVVVLFAMLLMACSKEPAVTTLPDPVPDQILPSDKEGLTLELKQMLFTSSPDVIPTVVRNDSGNDYRIGEFYHIEILKDDKWYIITYSDAIFLRNPNFKDFGGLLVDGMEAKQQFSVEALGVELPPGDYRLVKTFLSIGERYHEVSVAAPFTVQ